MFVKVITHSGGKICKENICTSIYECGHIFIRGCRNEKGKVIEGKKYVILETYNGSILDPFPVTKEMVMDVGNRVYVMNNKGETIDRVVG